MSATATWVYEGTRADIGARRDRVRFELLGDSLTVTSSSTAIPEITRVAHREWGAGDAFTRLVKGEMQSDRTSGLLWLVWSGGSQRKAADALSVGLTSEASRQVKAEAAKEVLRRWLDVSPEERAKQNRGLATLVERLSEERGTTRKLFR